MLSTRRKSVTGVGAPASGGTQAGGFEEGPSRALRGAAESSAGHIHNFDETCNYNPSCHSRPWGSDRISAVLQGQV